jgi:DNA-binding NtrC family response regulator
MFPQAARNAAAEAPHRRALVVDDEPLIRWSIGEALHDHGYSVIEAGTGRAAIQELTHSSDPFDAIVLDLRLPDSNDLSLLSRIHELAPRTRIIIMSAHGGADLAQEARARGAYEFVNKPFELSAMTTLVDEAPCAPPCEAKHDSRLGA